MKQINTEVDRSTNVLMTTILNQEDHGCRHTEHIVEGGYSVWWTDRQGYSQTVSNHLQKTLAHHFKSAEIRAYWGGGVNTLTLT